MVILSAFVFEHARLLLMSKTGNGRVSPKDWPTRSGYVGRNIMAHGDVRAMGAFDDFIINGFIGPGSAAMRIDDFNGNNFDHTGLGFIRGGTIGTSGDGTPVTRIDVLPPDVPSWGKEFKEFYTRYYTRTMDLNMQPETLPHQDNRVDLDPRHRDRWGLPLPRVTFDFHQNEHRLQKYHGRCRRENHARDRREQGVDGRKGPPQPLGRRHAHGRRSEKFRRQRILPDP